MIHIISADFNTESLQDFIAKREISFKNNENDTFYFINASYEDSAIAFALFNMIENSSNDYSITVGGTIDILTLGFIVRQKGPINVLACTKVVAVQKSGEYTRINMEHDICKRASYIENGRYELSLFVYFNQVVESFRIHIANEMDIWKKKAEAESSPVMTEIHPKQHLLDDLIGIRDSLQSSRAFIIQNDVLLEILRMRHNFLEYTFNLCSVEQMNKGGEEK